MKTLAESIFNADDNLRKADEHLDYDIVMDVFYSKMRKKSPKDLDMFSQPLKEGDLVLAILKNRPCLGVIKEVSKGTCVVEFKSEFGTCMCGCYDVMKIKNPKIFKQEQLL